MIQSPTLEVRKTERFNLWLHALADSSARVQILARLARLATGHLGDWRSVGRGVRELRIQYGPGYRVYFIRAGARIVLLLAGGDKSSQKRDIARAQALAATLVKDDHDED